MTTWDPACKSEGCQERTVIHDREGSWCRVHYDEREEGRRERNRQATEDAGGPWPQTCPRRYEDLGPRAGGPNQDRWDIREQMAHGLVARHCSYCGSLHPDDFMEKVREGWAVGATDKNYKAYLAKPNQPGGMESKFYFQHLNDDQKREFVDLYNAGRVHMPGGRFYRYPFFMGPKGA